MLSDNYQAKWRREERLAKGYEVRERARQRYQEKKDVILHQVKSYQDANADKIAERKRQKYFSHSPEVRKHNALMKNYGISLDDYQKMYEALDGKCTICKLSYEVLCVDHNHLNGEIRGLLCQKCNHGIGLFSDNIETLQEAINYLGKGKKK